MLINDEGEKWNGRPLVIGLERSELFVYGGEPGRPLPLSLDDGGGGNCTIGEVLSAANLAPGNCICKDSEKSNLALLAALTMLAAVAPLAIAECGGKKGRLFSEIDEGGEPLPLLEISSFLSTGELPAAAVLNNGKDSFGRDIRSCGDRPGNDDSKLKGS